MMSDKKGIVYLVGIGPGSEGLLAPDAALAIESADTIVGYTGYLEMIASRLVGKRALGRELGEETARGELAIEIAERGGIVAVVSSGDAGIYGMAGVVQEVAAKRRSEVEIVVIPGVTAACSAAARLGAPLAHDWASISLSDLLTPWDVITKRVQAAARADFVIALYNPTSKTRAHRFAAIVELLLRWRSPETPVGLVENAYRPGENIAIVRLGDLLTAHVTMFTIVIVGSSKTFVDRSRMITPRIYAAKTIETLDDEAEPIERPAAIERDDPVDPRVRRSEVGDSILARSFELIDAELGVRPRDPAERAILRRTIHASADFDYVHNIRFGPGAIEAAVRGLRAGGTILVDVEMLRAGIRSDWAGELGVEIACGLNHPACLELARTKGLTRTAAGIRLALERAGAGTIVAIGNAPTAIQELIRMVQEGFPPPACAIGVPVGFVGVEEAKQQLSMQRYFPYLTSAGRKGGTAVVAAIVNALLEIARDGADP
jgi:precorrin-3B C17-methyltransferase